MSKISHSIYAEMLRKVVSMVAETLTARALTAFEMKAKALLSIQACTKKWFPSFCRRMEPFHSPD